MTGLEPVDLVQRDHDRHAELEHALRDEAVAGADALARGEHEQDGVDVVERAVDRALHPLGQRVERPLEAGQVGEHELRVRRRCAIPKMRRRVVCGLSETIATLPPRAR